MRRQLGYPGKDSHPQRASRAQGHLFNVPTIFLLPASPRLLVFRLRLLRNLPICKCGSCIPRSSPGPFNGRVPPAPRFLLSFLATRHLSVATVAKSFICHTSEETTHKSFPCHTSKNPLPQVLCLPHIQDPPGPLRPPRNVIPSRRRGICLSFVFRISH